MLSECPEVQKNEKVSDLSDAFVANFNKFKISIAEKIENSEKQNQDNLPVHFNDIKRDIQELHKFISESTKFLPAFNIKLALDQVNSLVERTELEQIKLLPKKKFAFKTKHRNQPSKDTPDTSIKGSKAIVVNFQQIGFKNLQNENAEKQSSEISLKDVGLYSCTDSTIYLYGYPSTVHIRGLKNCQIFAGPVTTSVFIEDCSDCKFSVACQQLRVHSTLNSDFYLHVTSRGIIEDSKGLRFAPYNWSYPSLQSDFKSSGLVCTNNWQQIDDFNWLSKEVPSPNWSVLEERIGDAV